jgi:hypothetical protein
MVIASEIPHLDIRDWLHRLELLTEYEDNFKQFSEVKELIGLNESDIKELGVKNSAHRARMVASLVALKGKSKFYFQFNIFHNLLEIIFPFYFPPKIIFFLTITVPQNLKA